MKFSIIIPTFNRSKFISKAIVSVLNQTFNEWELIIIDDGSTDNTGEIVKSFEDSRLKYFYQENQERSIARNNGIEKSIGDYICFLDSDDYYEENHLQIFYNYIKQHNKKRIFLNSGLYKLSNGKKYKSNIEALIGEKNVFEEIFYTPLITPNTVCISRELLHCDRFPENYNIWEDTHLWLRLIAQYDFEQLNHFSVVQFEHDERGVTQGMINVKLENVSIYLNCINDLFENHLNKIKSNLSVDISKNKLIYSKIDMYAYQARKNKQLKVAFKLEKMKLGFGGSRFQYLINLIKITVDKIL